MKPQFLLTTALLAMILVYLPVDAAFTTSEKQDTKDPSGTVYKPQPKHQPTEPVLPGERHPLMGGKENKQHTSAKGTHAEEDGKHHHFHMDRVRRLRRFFNIFCLLTKFFLAITHICILITVFKAIISH